MTDLSREDVARLLQKSEPHPMDPPGAHMGVRCEVLNALCRTWLAVQYAPEGTVDFCDDDHALEVNMGRYLNADEHRLVSQRVRLVRVQGVGNG